MAAATITLYFYIASEGMNNASAVSVAADYIAIMSKASEFMAGKNGGMALYVTLTNGAQSVELQAVPGHELANYSRWYASVA